MTWKLIFIRGNELKMLVQLVVCACHVTNRAELKSQNKAADKRIEFNFMSQKIVLIARAGWAGASLAHRRSEDLLRRARAAHTPPEQSERRRKSESAARRPPGAR